VPITVLLGLQWGDEGKGKMIDILSSSHSHVVRSHGGANAGHTLVIQGKEYKFHLVPSGILYSHARCYLSGGIVFDPEVFLEELEQLHHAGISYAGRLFISQRAHVLFPFHKLIDKSLEVSRGQNLIGTTGKGIGPCYTDKVSRTGMTFGEFINEEICLRKLKNRFDLLDPQIRSHCDFDELVHKCSVWRKRLRDLCLDVEHHLYQALNQNQNVLIEGAHGTMLDISYGTYPFVTSSGCIAASVVASAGLGPTYVQRVCGVVKAYSTRVGSGPMPTELKADEQKLFMTHHQAREIGTTTGRTRRMGWLDIPLLRRSIELSGVTDIVLTKLDILDQLQKIKICTHYEYQGQRIDVFPFETEILDHVKPVYIELDGWMKDTSSLKSWDQLPEKAKIYKQMLEDLLGVKISYIFVGPDREQTIKC
jgi:adenylosuccinate synthase